MWSMGLGGLGERVCGRASECGRACMGERQIICGTPMVAFLGARVIKHGTKVTYRARAISVPRNRPTNGSGSRRNTCTTICRIVLTHSGIDHGKERRSWTALSSAASEAIACPHHSYTERCFLKRSPVRTTDMCVHRTEACAANFPGSVDHRFVCRYGLSTAQCTARVVPRPVGERNRTCGENYFAPACVSPRQRLDGSCPWPERRRASGRSCRSRRGSPTRLRSA